MKRAVAGSKRRGDAITAVELFAGAGGLSLGFEQADPRCRVAYATDIDEACEATYKANHATSCFERRDVREVQAAHVRDIAGGSVDFLIGGPPCQGFSIIGARDPEDERNDLFNYYLDLVQELRPKAVLMENVPGMLTLGGGEVVREILRRLDAIGYRAACREVVAAQYGVPQMRWRLVFIGWRADLGLDDCGFPDPTHGRALIGQLRQNGTNDPELLEGMITAGEALRDLPPVAAGGQNNEYVPPKELTTYQRQMRERLIEEGRPGTLFNHYAPALSPQNIERIKALKPGQDWRDLPRHLLPPGMQRAKKKDHTRRFRRMRWDTVPRAVITRFRDPKSGEYIHPEQERTISIREAARIQSFPDWYEFKGRLDQMYDQVGNAVPPLMAQAIVREMIACLEGRPTAKRRQILTSRLQTCLAADGRQESLFR